MDQIDVAAGDRPLLRRVFDYPLVALLVALASTFLTIIFAAIIARQVVPPISGLGPSVKFDLVCALLLLLLYKLFIRHLGEHPRDDLPLRGALRPLSIGIGTGGALFSAIVAIAALLGVYRLLGNGDFSDFLPQLILSAIFPAISEEMVFRGILFRWLEEFGGSWAALLLTSAFFGAAHLANPHASPIAAAGIAFEAGVMLGAAYMLSRSLWLPMGIHAAWNFFQGEVFDIPVSGMPVHGLVAARLDGPPLLTGNGFGLEASPIAISVATLFGLCLLYLAVRKGEVIEPRWVRARTPAGATA